MRTASSPKWMRNVLLAAGAYNVVWGAVVVAAPGLFFDLAGMERPLYPVLWQCIGMIVGVYGVGYAIAASDPAKHWPIVLVGLLGKTLGPIGFGWTVLNGDLPVVSGLTILTNDVVWWAPFAMILVHAARENTNRTKGEAPELKEAISRPLLSGGRSLLDLSTESPVLLVFLRHFGCTFCREALSDIRHQREVIELSGTRIVLVHMADESDARETLKRYGLESLDSVSDPDLRLYRAFGLERGGVRELFGPAVWLRGFVAAIFGGHGIGRLAGDGFQMPGVFLIQDGGVRSAYIHETAGDRPDYAGLSCGAFADSEAA